MCSECVAGGDRRRAEACYDRWPKGPLASEGLALGPEGAEEWCCREPQEEPQEEPRDGAPESAHRRMGRPPWEDALLEPLGPPRRSARQPPPHPPLLPGHRVGSPPLPAPGWGRSPRG